MKLLLPLTLLLASLLQSKAMGRINPLNFQCTLSIEVSPLEYMFVTRSMSVRIRFVSNCLKLRDFVFELPFNLKDRLSLKKHPTIVEVDIFGNKYSLSFKNKEASDMNTILRKFRYNEVSLSPTQRPSSKNVDCSSFNRIFLDERRKGSFGVNRLNSMLYMENPIRCASQDDLKKMICRLK